MKKNIKLTPKNKINNIKEKANSNEKTTYNLGMHYLEKHKFSEVNFIILLIY